MDKKLFERLAESMTQMNEIIDGERVPSREIVIDAIQVKEIRKATGLTQEKFCKLIDVKMGTLRNWEQGRREPTAQTAFSPVRRACVRAGLRRVLRPMCWWHG